MAKLGNNNYLNRKVGRKTIRNWWLVKAFEKRNKIESLPIVIDIRLPTSFIGKKIRIKIEEV